MLSKTQSFCLYQTGSPHDLKVPNASGLGNLTSLYLLSLALINICQYCNAEPFHVLSGLNEGGGYFSKCSIYQTLLKAFVSFGKNGEIWQKLCSIKSSHDSQLMQLHTQRNQAKSISVQIYSFRYVTNTRQI